MKWIMENIKPYAKSIMIITDFLLLAISFSVIALLRGASTYAQWILTGQSFILCLFFIEALMILFNGNSNIWEYAGARDYLVLVNIYAVSFACFFVLNRLVLEIAVSELAVLLSVVTALLLSIYMRALYRWLNHRVKKIVYFENKRLLVIIGAGNAGVALQEEITRNPKSMYTIWGFFDDDHRKIGMTINGIKVYGPINDLPEIINDTPVCEIVLAIPSLGIERRREIVEMCRLLDCDLRIMPDAMILLGNEGYKAQSIREVRVEDLLGRTSISFDKDELEQFVAGKTVMVSGGGGSIGSEIARQLIQAGVKNLIIFDINENDSYILFRELEPITPQGCQIYVEIGSMVDKKRVDSLFNKYRPEVVFHAAAHKHVPLMENCPCEAVYNNIFGTYNLLTAAQEAKCRKFVLISTDKAVNPTNIMGTTKRYCEDMMRAFSGVPGNVTDFVSVRFGNVLGSHGSVIPLFKMQIAQGGPVTVTDRRMTRFFMTIPEAVGLVIKAGAMAKCSETYILDMGEPVRIIDLAENLIRLSGFEPYHEIQIVETGLRPGEKLYEELLVNDEKHTATSDSKIFIELNGVSISKSKIDHQLSMLEDAINRTDDEAIIALMRSFVPNFRSPDEVNGQVDKADSKGPVLTVVPAPSDAPCGDSVEAGAGCSA